MAGVIAGASVVSALAAAKQAMKPTPGPMGGGGAPGMIQGTSQPSATDRLGAGASTVGELAKVFGGNAQPKTAPPVTPAQPSFSTAPQQGSPYGAMGSLGPGPTAGLTPGALSQPPPQTVGGAYDLSKKKNYLP